MKRITDKMRLEFLFDSSTPLYANRGTHYVLNIKQTLYAENKLTYRQAIDKIMRQRRLVP
jgi:hypothetical protein